MRGLRLGEGLRSSVTGAFKTYAYATKAVGRLVCFGTGGRLRLHTICNIFEYFANVVKYKYCTNNHKYSLLLS